MREDGSAHDLERERGVQDVRKILELDSKSVGEVKRRGEELEGGVEGGGEFGSDVGDAEVQGRLEDRRTRFGKGLSLEAGNLGGDEFAEGLWVGWCFTCVRDLSAEPTLVSECLLRKLLISHWLERRETGRGPILLSKGS